jgi:hypothetical protein
MPLFILAMLTKLLVMSSLFLNMLSRIRSLEKPILNIRMVRLF